MNTSTHNNDSAKNRSSLALRGAVSAATATAVLLGGFGAFALWTDSGQLGFTGNLQTGHLAIDAVTPGAWTFEGDVDTNDEILPVGTAVDPASFRVSPGDILEWNGNVTVNAQGDDLRGRLTVEEGTIVKPLGEDYVTVTVAFADGSDAVIEGTSAGVTETVPVKVRVEFARENFGQDVAQAVTLNGMALSLQQINGPAS